MLPQMASIDEEDRAYQQEVQAVKQWWTDSRWRYTKRTFTAEQIVSKRGNLKIQYPSNEQSKKVWRTLEARFKVLSHARKLDWSSVDTMTEQGRKLHVWLLGPRHGHPDGQVH